MPPPPTLKISEIFASVQGEGLRQGLPTLFVRTAGCNLRCAFCDTKRAWRGGRRMTVADVVGRLKRLQAEFPARWVCLTGGEPLRQDVAPLVSALKKEGWKVQLETNGILRRDLRVDWLTVSPKPPSYALRREYGRRAGEVKLVVSRELSLETILRLRRRMPRSTPLLLQPQSGRAWSSARAFELLGGCVRAGLENVRLSVQAHKELGLR